MHAKKKYKMKAKVWLYPGEVAWHFVNVDRKQSEALKKKYGQSRRGFGSLPVEVTIGKTLWKTSVFPDTHSGTYLLPLKAKVRAAEDIEAGDTVTFSIKVLLNEK